MNARTVNRAVQRRHLRPVLLGLTLASLLPGVVTAVDFSAAPEHEVVLFQPGQASWEWVMTQSDHSGAGKFREGKNCRGCHDGEQADIGASMVSGNDKLEPTDLGGRPGSTTVYVRTARDADRLYFQFRWTPAAPSGRKMADIPARITVMLDDGGLRESARAGCWAMCHDDAIGMASATDGSEVTKYLGGSRVKLTRHGGPDLKPAADIEALLAQDGFLEFWQAELRPGQPAVAVGGYVLERRHQSEQTTVAAEAEFSGGQWHVTLSRPLAASGPGQKALTPGKRYAVGFALHDDYNAHRFHQVSLEYALQLDADRVELIDTSP